jgi:hypothetical protein
VDVDNALTDIFAEPEVANQPGGNTDAFYNPDPPCANDLRQVASVVIPNPPSSQLSVTADFLRAQTIFTACGVPCVSPLKPPAQANASVADVVVTLGGHTIVAKLLSARAAASCDGFAKETLSGSSSVLSVTIDGMSVINLNQPVTIPANPPNPLINVYFNRQITGTAPDGDVFLTQRALEVTSPGLGADVVAGEATADFNGTPCSTP